MDVFGNSNPCSIKIYIQWAIFLDEEHMEKLKNWVYCLLLMDIYTRIQANTLIKKIENQAKEEVTSIWST